MAEQRRRKQFQQRGEQEYEQKIIDLARVTRVTKGGKRMRFRACVVIGDKKGRIGFGVAKGADVTLAIAKAVNKAQKKIIIVPIINETIPCEIREKFCAAKVLLKPAVKGRGIIAGGAARSVFELAGIPNIACKILGSKNKINNVKATFFALERLSRMMSIKGRKLSAPKMAAPENREKSVIAPTSEMDKASLAKPIIEKSN